MNKMDIIAIITVCIAALTTVFNIFSWVKRRPHEAVALLQSMVDNLRKEYEGWSVTKEILLRKIKDYEWLIKDAEEKAKKNYQICQLNHEVARLELMFLRKQTGYKVKEKVDVLMVDDQPITDEQFKRQLSSVSLINYEGFSVIGPFLEVANLKKAPFLIIDYKLDKGWTADDVIKQLRYSPEKVFIISVSGESESRIYSDNIVFFKKDDFYVYHIEMAIIKFLTDKIKI